MKNSKKPSGLQNLQGIFSPALDLEMERRLVYGRDVWEFHKMAHNDAICGAILLALTNIFKGVEWKVFNDEKGVLADSLKAVNWKGQMDDIVSFLVHGHSVFEVTIKQSDDGRYLWDGMYFRPQRTIVKWNYDDKGNFTSIEQQTPRGESATIKLSKCLRFATHQSQTNPRGKSIFRNAYRDWYYKTNIEKIEAIGIERDLTGLPVLKAPEDAELTDEKGNLNAIGDWAWQTVRKIKKNSQEGLVLPPNWEFELVGSPGQRQFDLNSVIARFSANMALSMLSQFLILGVVNSSGSFALSKEQSSLFYKAVEGFANVIVTTVNTSFIGAPALALMNDLETVPYIAPVGIDKPSIADLAAYLGRLIKLNAITPDDKLEEYLRDLASLPERDVETSREANQSKPAPVGGTTKGDTNAGN